ncbi:uncharacterized protein LOC110880209 [Helianthus annuus]|uniref:uncharacterized protein LOC110880209 n=1 Tax=Helianthus annuus TaxID=4232 RepID=UPI001652CF76|nr:uncharacterized protein LOC110880209 [Helianthus annuus]
MESSKIEHAKRVEQLRKMELKRADYMKTEKAKKEVEKLESIMMVSSQAIESTSDEIVKLREEEPQLVELVKGLKKRRSYMSLVSAWLTAFLMGRSQFIQTSQMVGGTPHGSPRLIQFESHRFHGLRQWLFGLWLDLVLLNLYKSRLLVGVITQLNFGVYFLQTLVLFFF